MEAHLARPAQTPSSAHTLSPMVGRDGELATLLELTRKPPAVVLVEGEAGVGKTRLVREMLGRANRARVLIGHCHPLREPFPFGPIVEGLARAGNQPRPGELPPITGVLRRLLPELDHWLPAAPPDAGDSEVERHQSFRAVRELLGALAPAMLAIEDIHWADGGTLELLRYLGGEPPVGVCLLLTSRPEDIRTRKSGPLPGVRHRVLRLGPLDADAVGRLAAAILGTDQVDQEFAAKLHERTDGLPFAVEELLRPLHGGPGTHGTPDTVGTAAAVDRFAMPAALRAFLGERLDRLPGPARRIADAAAVLGLPSEEGMLTAVAGLSRATARVGLTEALRHAVLRSADGLRYGFAHSLAADAAYDALPAPARRRLHDRAERALRALTPPPNARLAHHAGRAGHPRAFRYAELAADEAVHFGDNVAAAALLRTALETADLPTATRARLTVKLARAATLGLDHTDVVPLLHRILATEDLPSGDRGEIRLSLGLMLCNQGVDSDAGIEQIARAAAELRARPNLAARAMSALAVPDHTDGPVEENLRALDNAMRLLPRVSDPVQRTALLVNRASTLLCLGDPAAWPAIEALPSSGGSAAEDQQLHRGLCNFVNNCLTLGHYAPAAEFLQRTGSLEATPAGYTHSLLAQFQMHLDFAEGRWGNVRGQAKRQTRSELPALRQDGSMMLGILALLDGDTADARRRIRAACPADTALRPRTDAMTIAWLVRVLLDLDQPRDAVAAARPLLTAVRRKGAWVWAAELVPAAVDALLAANEPAEAAALVDEFRAGVADRDAPLSSAAAKRCRARITELDRPAGAVDAWLAAQRAYTLLPRPYDAALAAASAGRCQNAAGHDGSAHLELALAELDRLGARADTARCRAELRAAGKTLANGRGRPAYGNDLSPREQEILDLVTRGHTNRQIAADLYLSERTVEGHVSHLLHKLGLRTRRELWTTADDHRG